MLEEIPSILLTEWMAYYNLEPFGAEMLDLHFAKFQAMMASSKDNVKDPQKFRLWKKVADLAEKFDPLKFYQELKGSFGLTDKK